MPTIYRDFFGNIVAQSATPTDTITGSTGSEPLYGTNGADLIADGGGSHTMYGGLGDDTYQINGPGDVVVENPGAGVDTLQIRNLKLYTLADDSNIENLFLFGKMTVSGNDQNNLIVGNLSPQVINGGGGDDVIVGGPGADTFVFGAGSGYDVVTDFTPSQSDKIRIQDYGFMNFGQITAAMTQVGSDVVLQLDSSDAIKFLNTTIAGFHATDFQLASDSSNLNLTFDDEFNGPLSLYDPGSETGTWSTSFASGDQTGQRAYTSHTLRNNGEKEIYVDPSFVGSGTTPLGLNPFAINNGVLDITGQATTDAQKASLWYYKYTSGLLTTQHSFAQTYGYFEMKAELPSGQGVWPAFWLLPASGGSPPELDVMENIGASTAYFTSHSTINGVNGFTGFVPNISTQFHTYGLLWTNKELTWYVDGQAVASMATPADMNQPMYMLVNLAIGGSFPGNPPPDFSSATMQVDYVRAYSLNAGGGEDGDLGVTVAQTVVGDAQKSHVVFNVTGLDAGATGVVTFLDSLGNSVALNVSTNGVGTADLTSLADGSITVTVAANAPDGSVLPGVGQTLTIDPTISSALSVALPFDIGAAQKADAAFQIAGLDQGETATVTFTDTLNQVVTVTTTTNGPLTADLSSLADGNIKVAISENDGLGHVLSGVGGKFSLDTTADDLGDLSVSVTPLANAQNASRLAFGMVGLDKDAVAVVTFTDGLGHAVSTTVNSSSSPFVDLSSLTDGQITVTVTATDDAGNTASGIPVSFTLDTTADVGGDLAVAVNQNLPAAGETAVGFTVSGLDGDATAVVTFTDSVNHTVTANVTANGAGTADLSSLVDGTITVSIAATDLAGNTASGAGSSLTLDTTADAGGDLAVSADTALVGPAGESAVGFTVAGLDADATAVVTFTDSANHTVTANVSANGAGTADLSSLAGGAITVSITATDTAGNTANGAGSSLNLDTTADIGGDLTVTMNQSLVGAAGETATAFTVSGLDADAAAVVTFTDSANHTVTANVSANGAGTADLSGLVDGTITVAITATDVSGNTANGTGSSLSLDTTADAGGDLAVAMNQSLAGAAGETAVGFTVAGLDADATAVVTFTDSANHTVTANATANGAGTADLSSLIDGTITVSIAATDTAGNTANGTGSSLTLDTTADAGGDLAVVMNQSLIGPAGETAVGFTVAGLDADATAVVTFTDSANHTVTANVSANGAGTADLSSLTDGTITVSIAATDTVGNIANGAGSGLTLDTTADTGGDLAVAMGQSLVSAAGETAVGFTVAGLDADATAVVTFTDSANHTVTANVSANGAGTADLSSLTDGTVTVSIAATDTVGNTANGTGSSLTLDTTADAGGDLAVAMNQNLVAAAGETAAGFTVSGLDADATAVVTFTDSANHTVTANVTANGAGTADLSSLIDGTITVSIAATDAVGNTANGTGSALTLDTTADAGGDLAVALGQSLVSAAGETAVGFTVAGLDADATAIVTFTDGANHTVTANISANGAGTADLSSLIDGTITVSIAATDTVGNTANGTGSSLTLDTTADAGGDLAVAVGQSLAGAAGETAIGFTVAGLDADATAVVTFADSANHTVTANVSANGAGTADLSGLVDGAITVSIAATDAVGNTANGTGSALTLDTTADVGGDLAVAMNQNLVATAGETAAGFTVSGLDADATAVVTFTDSANHSVTANVAANGVATANLIGLTDGPITVSIAATDTAGNTANGTGSSLTLDTTADAGGDLAVAMGQSLVGAASETAVGFTVSGLDADATAVVTFTDSANHTVTANVAANGAGTADLGSLTDGTITVSIAATDAAGNTANGSASSLTLDTNADAGGDLAISAGTSAVNAYEKTYVPFIVSGLDSDATAVVTFKDSLDRTLTVDVAGNGAGLVNLSSLAAGAISITIKATDALGNTASVAGSGLTLAPGTIEPLDSSNVLIAAAGNSQLHGGAGDDLLVGGAGNNLLDGGAGSDTASYDTALAGVTVSLVTTTAQKTGGAGTDTLVSIENLIGSAFNDKLTGDAGANVLLGGAGNDNLKGGDGDDVLAGGAGNDTIAGGAGVDTVSYFDAPSGVTVSLAITAAQNTGGGGTDTVSSVENLTGSDFNDQLTGNGNANVITGGAGDDVLTGGKGADQLFGGAGADRFVFTATADSKVATPDQIMDFSHAEGDRIDLSAIDANTHTTGDDAFVLTGSFTHVSGQLIQIAQSGGYLVEGDVNGDGKADFAIFVHAGAPLVSSDFIL